ncbi:cytochrome c oxidase subunit II [Inquilinus sp.]|uniref:cytochrome c oxidase subunit II n=1 Tax=Inquilinus sp. TaxID=1932117 RepID=UPI0031E24C66
MSGFIPLWPDAASAHAGQVDLLVIAFTVLMVALTAPVFILIVVFAVRYRRGKAADRSHPVNRNVWLEVSWAAIPFLLTLIFFVWAAWLYFDLHRPPANAMEIDVVAKRWMWKFQHPEGQREIDDLHVPAGQPVKLTMTSEDVIHSLFVPALRVKQDVLPGRYTTLWFNADRPGSYPLECTQFCGTDHSLMRGRLVVMAGQDYASWLAGTQGGDTLAAEGKALFRSLGCSGCHDAGATVHAPRLEGLFGRPVPLQDGSIVTADEQYIRDSILEPNSQVAAGYPPIMPTFRNVVDEGGVQQLVAYIKSLGPQPGSPPP